MLGIVVLLQSQGLSAQGLFDLLLLPLEALAIGLDRLRLIPQGSGQLVAQQAETVGTEKALCHELPDCLQHYVLLDAEDARVSRQIGVEPRTPAGVLTAVPVGALLVAALHPASADATADSPAQDVEATRPRRSPIRVAARS